MTADPTVMDFPLWRGQDVRFVAHNRDSIPFPANTTAQLVFAVGRRYKEFDAVIDGDRAIFEIPGSELDSVRTKSSWRLQFIVNGKSESPLFGRVVRKDK